MQGQSKFGAVSLLAISIMLGGCAIKPVPITDAERDQMIQKDLSRLYENQEPVSGALTLEQALSRAERYNLDHRLHQMQRVMSDRALALSNMDMLPKLVAQAGYSSRDKETASTSRLVDSGISSNNPSTSVERKHTTDSLAFSWNILDFGVSYFQAQQAANATLMEEEGRRRVLNSLTQDVRSAYWDAYAAQMAEPEMDALIKRVTDALTDADRIERDRLMPPAQILLYKKTLLEQAQQLEALQGEMQRSRVKLAALINVPPTTPLQLAADASASMPSVNVNPDELEKMALQNRPEIREAQYEKRNAALEAKKLLTKMLPGIEFSYGYYHDTNKYLVNNGWRDASVQVSWNLLNLLRYSDSKAYIDAQQQVGEAKRLALTMAVIAQVHVAWHDYQQAMHQYQRMQTLLSIEEGLRAQIAAKSRESAGSQLEDIRAASSLLLTRLRAQQSRAHALQAEALLETSIGKDTTMSAPAAAATTQEAEKPS